MVCKYYSHFLHTFLPQIHTFRKSTMRPSLTLRNVLLWSGAPSVYITKIGLLTCCSSNSLLSSVECRKALEDSSVASLTDFKPNTYD